MGTGASHASSNNSNKAKTGSNGLVGGAAGMPSSAAVNAAAAANASGGARRANNKHQQRTNRLNAIIPTAAVEYLSCLPWAKFGIQPPPPPVKIPLVPVFLGTNLTKSMIFNRLQTIVEDGHTSSSHPVRVVFIFGGPGTYKGRMIDDIVNMFGMQLLSGENIIIKHLFDFFSKHRKSERDKQQAERMAKMPIGGGFGARPKSPTPSLSSIDHKLTEIRQLENIEMKKLQELLRMRPELLTLEWLLERIADEIEYSVSRERRSGFLIDIMPNQRFLLKSEFFIKECSNELAVFESRFPIALCLNLAMPQEKLLDNLDTAHKAGDKMLGASANHHHHNNNDSAHTGSSSSLSSAHSSTTQTSASNVTVAAGDEPLPSLPSGTSDEMDASRMQKRYTLYESSAYNFLHYFTNSGRVFTIDCSSKLPPLIWQKLCDSLIELGFEPDRPSSVVILFGFEPDTFALYDLSKYRIAHVYLADILMDEALDPKLSSPEQAYVAINKHVHNDMAKATAFAVELSSTVLASPSMIASASRPASSTVASTALKTARIEPIAGPSESGHNRTHRSSSTDKSLHQQHHRGSKSVEGTPYALRTLGQNPKVFPASSRGSVASGPKPGILQHTNKNGDTLNGSHDSNANPVASSSSTKLTAAPSGTTSNARRRIPKLVPPRQKEDLLFVEVHEVLLDKYVQLQSGNVRKMKRKNSLSARRFKAICLPEQELVCLFPDSVDTRTCKIISTGIVNAKRKVYRDRRDSRRSSSQSDTASPAATSGAIEVFDNNNNNNNMNGAGSTITMTSTTPTFQLPMPSRHMANKLTPPIVQH